MNLIEKRDYIHNHLHQVNEPALNDLYQKLVTFPDDSLIEESDDDIKNGNLTSHDDFKQEVKSWRPTK